MKEYLNKIQHIGKRYYAGRMLRAMIEDKNGKSVYCDKCFNIANGIKRGKILGITYRIPLCKKHFTN